MGKAHLPTILLIASFVATGGGLARAAADTTAGDAAASLPATADGADRLIVRFRQGQAPSRGGRAGLGEPDVRDRAVAAASRRESMPRRWAKR